MGDTLSEARDYLAKIAKDRAAEVKSLQGASVVLVTIPEWAQRHAIKAWFGLSKDALHDFVIRGLVTAKKVDPYMAKSMVIYKVADVREAIEGLTDYAEWLKSRVRRRHNNKKNKEEK
jgi:hypothetical protein